MTRKTTIPTRPGFHRTCWHVLAWIGWTFLVLGVSAMSLKNRDAFHTITPAHFSWSISPANSEVAPCDGQIDSARAMASTAGTITAGRSTAAPLVPGPEPKTSR